MSGGSHMKRSFKENLVDALGVVAKILPFFLLIFASILFDTERKQIMEIDYRISKLEATQTTSAEASTVEALQEEVEKLEAKIKKLSKRLNNEQSADLFGNYSTEELFDFSTYELDGQTKKGFYDIGDLSAFQYQLWIYVDSEYTAGREVEWINALRQAVQTNPELKTSLINELGYYFDEDDHRKATEAELEEFLSKMRLAIDGNIYFYDKNGNPRFPDIYLRPDRYFNNLYCLFPAINY